MERPEFVVSDTEECTAAVFEVVFFLVVCRILDDVARIDNRFKQAELDDLNCRHFIGLCGVCVLGFET